LPCRKHTANAAARIRNVTGVTRDQVHVDVHARLTSSRTDVYADVVSIGRESALNMLLSFDEQLEDGHLFVFRHVEEARHVAPRDDENVASAQGVVVVAYVRKSVLQNDIRRLTQIAR